MKKNLVLYFSVYGTSKKTAEEIAKQADAEDLKGISLEMNTAERGDPQAISEWLKELGF